LTVTEYLSYASVVANPYKSKEEHLLICAKGGLRIGSILSCNSSLRGQFGRRAQLLYELLESLVVHEAGGVLRKIKLPSLNLLPELPKY
jgi:hypothetical protein